MAGRRLERPDGQLLAPATRASGAVASCLVGEDRRVDDGERLAEQDRAGVQVQVAPLQAAQLTVAGPGCRSCACSDPRASPRAGPLLASDAGPHLDADALEVTMAIHHPDQLREALMRLHQADIAVERVELRTPTLDDVFFELTKAAA